MPKIEQSTEQPNTEALLEAYGAISHMREGTVAEAHAKHTAYNNAIIDLEQRLSEIHNETMSSSLDDGSQEEAADVRERDLIPPAISEFRHHLTRLHELIVKLEE